MMKTWIRAGAAFLAAIALAAAAQAPRLNHPAVAAPPIKVLCKSYAAVSGPADTAENALATCTIPAGAMGANGVLRVHTLWAYTNSANNKVLRVKFSTASFMAVTATTTDYLERITIIANRNATNSQGGSAAANVGLGVAAGGGTAATTAAIDTTAAVSVTATCQKASGPETCTLNGILVELIPG